MDQMQATVRNSVMIQDIQVNATIAVKSRHALKERHQLRSPQFLVAMAAPTIHKMKRIISVTSSLPKVDMKP
jgi:hypothetical protein